MGIVSTYPEQGVRVSLELVEVDDAFAHYRGQAFTPLGCHTFALDIQLSDGMASLHLTEITARDDGPAPASTLEGPPSLPAGDLGFIRQLGRQLWRQATQLEEAKGGGQWSRRVQRWRGPK